MLHELSGVDVTVSVTETVVVTGALLKTMFGFGLHSIEIVNVLEPHLGVALIQMAAAYLLAELEKTK